MNYKRIAALLLAVLCILAFSGCHMIKLNSDRDMAQVVAKVNGVEITKKEVYQAVATAYSQYSSQISSMSDEARKNMYQWMLEDMVSREVEKQKAAELGVDKLDDAKKAEVDQEFNDYIADLKNEITVPDNVAEADKNAYLEKEVEKELEANDSSIEKARQMFYDAAAIDALEASVKDKVAAPTEEQLKTVYDNLLQYQQVVYEQPFTKDEESLAVQSLFADTDLAAETLSTNVYSEDGVIVYYPKEEHRQGIYVKLTYSDDITKQITEINDKTDMSDDDKKAAIAPLIEQGKQALAQDVATVQAAFATDKSRTNFESVISKYSKDTDQSNYIKYGGYVTYIGDSTKEEAFQSALFGLKAEGDISEPAYSDTGCYIVMLTKIYTPGAIKTLDEVHDKLVSYETSSLQNTAWNNQLTTWKNEAKTQMFTDRLFN